MKLRVYFRDLVDRAKKEKQQVPRKCFGVQNTKSFRSDLYKALQIFAKRTFEFPSDQSHAARMRLSCMARQYADIGRIWRGFSICMPMLSMPASSMVIRGATKYTAHSSLGHSTIGMKNVYTRMKRVVCLHACMHVT